MEEQVAMNLVKRLGLVSRALRSMKAWIWRRLALVLDCWRRERHFLSIGLQSDCCWFPLIDHGRLQPGQPLRGRRRRPYQRRLHS
ncbi:hypothetical protein CK203_078959 [Vitis vinifera]|uniref:Uncharacterized protein n=1 Tax=Vitis vinifera TaxID=29760 RepID=A0A438DA78_VITVI|nr:hypothetical protein CK203_078959 [Vitis vinifera]